LFNWQKPLNALFDELEADQKNINRWAFVVRMRTLFLVRWI
jgi:hypothetical protein